MRNTKTKGLGHILSRENVDHFSKISVDYHRENVERYQICRFSRKPFSRVPDTRILGTQTDERHLNKYKVEHTHTEKWKGTEGRA